MKILMFGWEYPPVKSGGLGTACHGLTKEIARLGHEIIFVAPYAIRSEFSKHLNLVSARNYRLKVRFKEFMQNIINRINLPKKIKEQVTYKFVDSMLSPYLNETSYDKLIQKESIDLKNYLTQKNLELSKIIKDYEVVYDDNAREDYTGEIYGSDLFSEVEKYSIKAGAITLGCDFDLIAAHDWMTFGAAIKAKHLSGKPLIAHIHATEFDRTGGKGINQRVYELEKEGMEQADIVVANSNITKENCVRHYGIDPEKIIPVHLAIDDDEFGCYINNNEIRKSKNGKLVLFLGRMTLQKGPEYFLKAAAKVLKYYPEAKFVMAGSGDKLTEMIDLAAGLGISDKVFFTGFLKGNDIKKVFSMTDLFVLSSVAEPFGLVVLEAIKSGVPAIVSKNAGVAEVLSHVLKVDFWDIEEMANMIINVLKHDTLHASLQEHSVMEAKQMTWEETAKKTTEIYFKALKGEPVYA